MISQEHILAQRYARAFLNILQQPLSVADLQSIKKAISYFQEHSSIVSLLKIPLIEPSYKAKAISHLLHQRFQLPDSFTALISVLLKDKRSFLIKEILHIIYDLVQQQSKIMEFKITTAAPLSDEQKKSVEAFLQRKVDRTLLYEYAVDSALIAGIRMQSSRCFWEYSVAQILNEAERAMMKEIG